MRCGARPHFAEPPFAGPPIECCSSFGCSGRASRARVDDRRTQIVGCGAGSRHRLSLGHAHEQEDGDYAVKTILIVPDCSLLRTAAALSVLSTLHCARSASHVWTMEGEGQTV